MKNLPTLLSAVFAFLFGITALCHGAPVSGTPPEARPARAQGLTSSIDTGKTKIAQTSKTEKGNGNKRKKGNNETRTGTGDGARTMAPRNISAIESDIASREAEYRMQIAHVNELKKKLTYLRGDERAKEKAQSLYERQYEKADRELAEAISFKKKNPTRNIDAEWHKFKAADDNLQNVGHEKIRLNEEISTTERDVKVAETILDNLKVLIDMLKSERNEAHIAVLRRVVEKEETVEAIGEVTCENETVRKCQQMALEQAWRNAVERGSAVLVESLTNVEDFRLRKDSIYSKVRAIVLKTDIIERGWKGDNVYHCRINALVKGQFSSDFRQAILPSVDLRQPTALSAEMQGVRKPVTDIPARTRAPEIRAEAKPLPTSAGKPRSRTEYEGFAFDFRDCWITDGDKGEVGCAVVITNQREERTLTISAETVKSDDGETNRTRITGGDENTYGAAKVKLGASEGKLAETALATHVPVVAKAYFAGVKPLPAKIAHFEAGFLDDGGKPFRIWFKDIPLSQAEEVTATGPEPEKAREERSGQAVTGMAGRKASYADFSFELSQCSSITGTSIGCDFVVTNNGEDRVLGISKEARTLSQSLFSRKKLFPTRIFDEYGNEYIAGTVKFGTEENGSAKTLLIKGVPVRARLSFEDISPMPVYIPYLAIGFFDQENNTFKAWFRDIGVRGK